MHQHGPHVLITKLVQLTNHSVIPTAKGLSEMTYDPHQLIRNVKYHAPSHRFDCCIAGSVLQLLKSAVNCRPAKRLFKKFECISESANNVEQRLA